MLLSLPSLINIHYSSRGAKLSNETFTGRRELMPCPSTLTERRQSKAVLYCLGTAEYVACFGLLIAFWASENILKLLFTPVYLNNKYKIKEML